MKTLQWTKLVQQCPTTYKRLIPRYCSISVLPPGRLHPVYDKRVAHVQVVVLLILVPLLPVSGRRHFEIECARAKNRRCRPLVSEAEPATKDLGEDIR